PADRREPHPLAGRVLDENVGRLAECFPGKGAVEVREGGEADDFECPRALERARGELERLRAERQRALVGRAPKRALSGRDDRREGSRPPILARRELVRGGAVVADELDDLATPP